MGRYHSRNSLMLYFLYSNSQNSIVSFDYSWFLAKNLSNYVSLSWKLYKQYCHTVHNPLHTWPTSLSRFVTCGRGGVINCRRALPLGRLQRPNRNRKWPEIMATQKPSSASLSGPRPIRRLLFSGSVFILQAQGGRGSRYNLMKWHIKVWIF